MTTITSTHVEVTRIFRVSGAEPVTDSAGCPLDPEEVSVVFREIHGVLRAAWVGVKGRRMRGEKTKGTYNRGGFGIYDSGNIEPHYRRGLPPMWVQQVVNRAIQEQADGRGFKPAPINGGWSQHPEADWVVPVTVPQVNNGTSTLVVFAVPRTKEQQIGYEMTFDEANSVALGPPLVLTMADFTA
jgi:hypothetical protein